MPCFSKESALPVMVDVCGCSEVVFRTTTLFSSLNMDHSLWTLVQGKEGLC